MFVTVRGVLAKYCRERRSVLPPNPPSFLGRILFSPPKEDFFETQNEVNYIPESLLIKNYFMLDFNAQCNIIVVQQCSIRFLICGFVILIVRELLF